MWAVIIQILERRWSERQSSRRQLVRDVTALYRAMGGSYAAYQEFCRTHSDNSRKDWNRHVTKLVRVVKRLDPTLEIFGPDVQPVIREYAVFESLGIQAAFVTASTLERSLLTATPDSILDFYTRAYFDAHRELNRFIKENFTIEEVHSAFSGLPDYPQF